MGLISGPQGQLWPLKRRHDQHEVAQADRVVTSLPPPPRQQVWLADGLAAWASALMLPPQQ